MSEQLDIFRQTPAVDPPSCPDDLVEPEPPRKRIVVQLTELPGETWEDIFVGQEGGE